MMLRKTSVTLSDQELSLLDDIASSLRVSRSKLFKMIVAQYLEDYASRASKAMPQIKRQSVKMRDDLVKETNSPVHIYDLETGRKSKIKRRT